MYISASPMSEDIKDVFLVKGLLIKHTLFANISL